MTSTPVADVGLLANNVSTQKQAVKSGDSQKESFTLVMNKASLQNVSQPVHQAGQGPIGNSDKGVTEKGSAASEIRDEKQMKGDTTEGKKEVSEAAKDAKETTETNASKADKAGREETVVDEATSEALEDKAQELLEAVAKELGVEEEDIQKVLETLGLTAMDLFSQESLAAVVTEVAGTGNAIDLITNEGLYNAVQNLTDMKNQMLSEVSQELEIASQELMQQVKQLAENDRAASFPDMFSKDTTTQDQAPVIEVSMKAQAQPEEAPKQQSSEAQMTEEASQVTDEATLVHKSSEKQHSNANTGNDGENQQGHLFAQQTTLQNIGEFSEAVSEAPQLHNFNTQQIMEQIMDYLKVEVSPDMSQLEMQLHPETLGTLNIQVSNKNGLVTAQFTTQDENVKHVIESQLIQLKDTLNEQGIKVQAIEVNVSTRGFEKNLEQNSEQGTGEEQGQPKKGTRRLNLNDLDLESLSEDGEADSAIQIAADMMARNGNTLDYLV